MWVYRATVAHPSYANASICYIALHRGTLHKVYVCCFERHSRSKTTLVVGDAFVSFSGFFLQCHGERDAKRSSFHPRRDSLSTTRDVSSHCPFFATMLGSTSIPDGNVSHIEGKHVCASGSVTR